MKLLPLAAAAALLPAMGLAQTVTAPAPDPAPANAPADAAAAGLGVTDAYARSANAMAGAVFMVIGNAGPADCTLTGAKGDVAERIELHTHSEVDGVMRMMQVEGGFPVPAGGTHVLERGGDHIMMMGLARPLDAGDTVALTLDFGPCGTLPVSIPVDNQRGQGRPAAAPAMGTGHGAMHGSPAAPGN